jgi:hypothetical protein
MARFDSSAVLAGFSLLFGSGCTQTLDFDATSSEASSRPTFSCADHPSAMGVFCDDFEGKPLLESWTSVGPSTGAPGMITTDALDSLSPSHSMLVSYPGREAGAGFTALTALKQFPDFANTNISVVLEFDMKVEVIDATNDASVSAFQFLFGNADQYNQLVLNLRSRTTEVSSEFTENFGKPNTNEYGTIPGGIRDVPNLGQWAHVRFELEVNQAIGTNNAAKLFIDDVKLFDGALTYALFGLTPRMELGIPYVNVEKPTTPWSIRFDNVLATVTRK